MFLLFELTKFVVEGFENVAAAYQVCTWGGPEYLILDDTSTHKCLQSSRNHMMRWLGDCGPGLDLLCVNQRRALKISDSRVNWWVKGQIWISQIEHSESNRSKTLLVIIIPPPTHWSVPRGMEVFSAGRIGQIFCEEEDAAWLYTPMKQIVEPHCPFVPDVTAFIFAKSFTL